MHFTRSSISALAATLLLGSPALAGNKTMWVTVKENCTLAPSGGHNSTMTPITSYSKKPIGGGGNGDNPVATTSLTQSFNGSQPGVISVEHCSKHNTTHSQKKKVPTTTINQETSQQPQVETKVVISSVFVTKTVGGSCAAAKSSSAADPVATTTSPKHTGCTCMGNGNGNGNTSSSEKASSTSVGDEPTKAAPAATTSNVTSPESASSGSSNMSTFTTVLTTDCDTLPATTSTVTSTRKTSNSSGNGNGNGSGNANGVPKYTNSSIAATTATDNLDPVSAKTTITPTAIAAQTGSGSSQNQYAQISTTSEDTTTTITITKTITSYVTKQKPVAVVVETPVSTIYAVHTVTRTKIINGKTHYETYTQSRSTQYDARTTSTKIGTVTEKIVGVVAGNYTFLTTQPVAPPQTTTAHVRPVGTGSEDSDAITTQVTPIVGPVQGWYPTNLVSERSLYPNPEVHYISTLDLSSHPSAEPTAY